MKRKKKSPFQEPAVATLFKSYEGAAGTHLHELREIVFEAAAATEGVGIVVETLKWGQPSYLTPETKSGSTIRMDAVKGNDDAVALYFHCQTTLVPTFRDQYSETLNFEGNRSIVLDVNSPLPVAELRHCISQALTYHLSKKKRA